ncbi:MAG: hypothetical protein OXI52_04575 [Caldilineaceae bacterium]|nr:hypothetical protein [Caldilineaceae bacterium]
MAKKRHTPEQVINKLREAEDESLGKLCGMQATASRRAIRALPNMRGAMVYSLSADSLSQWKEGHISVRET